MAKKNTQPRYVQLKLRVNVPIQEKMELAVENTEIKKDESIPEFQARIRKNAIMYLAADQERPFEMVREVTDQLFLIFESFDVVPHEVVGDDGIFEVNLVCVSSEADKWVDTASIKRVAEEN